MSETFDSYLSRTVKAENAEKYVSSPGTPYERTFWWNEKKMVAEIELGYRVVDALIVQVPGDWLVTDRDDYYCTTCAASPYSHECSGCGQCMCDCGYCGCE